MVRTGSVFRQRWPFVAAVAVVVAVAVAAGSMFAANSGEPPVQEAAAAQVQPDLTDPGLYAGSPPAPNAAMANPGNPPRPALPVAAVAAPAQPDPDPGVNQVVPEGSSPLASWLADRPEQMGPFSIQDAMAAD